MTKQTIFPKTLALIACLIMLANNSVFKFELGNLYYVILIISFFILIISSKKNKLNHYTFMFFLTCFFSLLINDIPYFYKSNERFIAFLFLIALLGPLFNNQHLILFKKKLFKYLNNAIIILVSLSFIGLITNSSLVYMGRGGFTGFFNHSMFLSPMAAISMITCSYYTLKSPKRKRKIFFASLAFFSLIACLSAGSRAALISGILSILYLFYQANKNNLAKYLKLLSLIFIISITSYPLWIGYTEKLTEKMEYSAAQGGLTSTREVLWQRRIAEFNSSPIFGIGYANDSSKTENDSIIGEGQIEPGSSWLAVLAMTGLVGISAFLFLIFRFFKILRIESNDFSNYLLSLMVFFIFHMFAEGYILSAGSGLFFYFWLLLSFSDIIKYDRINIIKTTK